MRYLSLVGVLTLSVLMGACEPPRTPYTVGDQEYSQSKRSAEVFETAKTGVRVSISVFTRRPHSAKAFIEIQNTSGHEMLYSASQLQISGGIPPYDKRSVYVNSNKRSPDRNIVISSGKTVKIMLIEWNDAYDMAQPSELTLLVGDIVDQLDSTVVSIGSVKCILQSP
ncbi:MAG: hypothetical protein HY851_11740 [candidate division Zixibacteria bacterium]|nr:hypothetical protein [candidate division Zixibacteria bacterium]